MQLLIDPTRDSPWVHEDPIFRFHYFFFRPLWVRREALEAHYEESRELFPEDMPDLQFRDIWQNWQKRWIESREVRLQQDTPKHRRSAFFAHVKQYCGNAVWARLLVQFGPTALDKILPAMILARDMRPEVNLPVHDQARDHVRILMRAAAASHDPPAPMASASAPSGR